MYHLFLQPWQEFQHFDFGQDFHHFITKKVQGDSYKGILRKTSSKSHHQIIHKMELAKFGCRSDWKVEKLKNGAIFWQPAGTYCLHMVISELFP
jgi:hypothetical protein